MKEKERTAGLNINKYRVISSMAVPWAAGGQGAGGEGPEHEMDRHGPGLVVRISHSMLR